jgi:AcrR family transcriptional regulator
MPSITTRRSDAVERRAAVEARILAAVERLLEGGARFTDLGVQRIVEEAGVARSTFYTHFRDKTQLILRLAENLGTTAFGMTTTWDPEADDAVEVLEATTVELIRFYRERAHILSAVLEVSAYDEAARDFWSAQLEEFVARGREFVAAAQRAGHTPADLRADTAVRLFVWGGMQTIAHHIATGDPADDIAVARELARAQWFGAFRRPA